MKPLLKQQRALLMALGWWYLRRTMRRRAERTVAAIVSKETLGLTKASKSRSSRWKWLLTLPVVGGLAWFAWRRLGGGGGDDDWESWAPTLPEPPATEAPDPVGGAPASPEPAVPAGA